MNINNLTNHIKRGVAKVEESKNKLNQKNEIKNPQKMKLPLFRKLHIRPAYLALGIVITVLVVFFARVALWEHNYLAAKEGSERDITNVRVDGSGNGGTYGSGEEVDDTEPTQQQIAEYIVAADKPRYFSVPYLGIRNARIVEIGLKGQGEMGTPYNIYDVGWYTGSGSVLPGQNGVTIMNAHGGDLGYGIFKALPKLPIGETIRIEMGDGRIYTYKVIESVRKQLGEDANNYMATAFSPLTGTSNTLTLITCTGNWLDRQQTYDQRLFVRAALQ